ncbi:MAG: ATP-dependent zinc metalloprotease FtsH [Pseudomonadota bacterium]|uniref:ATP-dependent zinc metalloprotease FtsH n=1 Tax=Zoogloea ramigera TaxID=350 RepID=A0A4Y4CZ43_ZOORA|nr:ATP-dependent zinc metalloprotease FtsH [Zoogloea ramigera]MBP6800268.1 ATP-dependent zinc metalloprotease FtsH [Zoogloea sp.]MBP7626279.1 ATP-dependent zinc metalloprotease FtsH [Zoogloea sp.]GEC96979.1 ATP-dependent zinc metalloprotease FtsH [Zoogloea ramigera]
MQKKLQFSLWYFVFALLAVFTLHDLWVQVRSVEPVPYSEFQRMVKAGEVSEIAITENAIQGTLKKPLEDGRQKFVTTRVDPSLAKDLSQYDVKFTGVVENTLLRDILGWVLPAVIFVGIWIFAMRKFAGKQGMGGGFMNLGKSKAKVYVEADTGVSFGDVAGVDEAKDELKEVVGFLKDPKSYGRLGGRVPKGVLLVGPPGTGKTLLAKAVAGEAGVPFFSISGSEFVEMFVGVGAARVRDLFEQARAKAPAIIFIDELDAMGRARGAFGGMGGHDEKEQTLNQLLVELDGFDSSSGLVLLAATNRPEVLDPALLRAGRFDRQVLVDRPDKKGRIAILQVHMKKITLTPGIDADQVAALTPGFSGADLANLCNEAALVATRRDGVDVTLRDFTVAIERIVAGLEKKNRVLNEHERTVVAYHEMGHALVAMGLPGTDPVHKISIIPRGVGALGYTIQRPTEDRFLMTRAELENKMAVLLGGRAAEQLVFGEVSTGAADDLQKVTSIARSIVMRFGMHEELGNVAYDSDKTNFLGQAAPQAAERSYSEETAREIDCAVRQIVAKAFERSCAILAERRAILEDTARDLLARETLDEADLKAIHDRVTAEA